MSRKEKLLEKIAGGNGQNIQFSDFIAALRAAGFTEERNQGTSHQIWKTPAGDFMNVQPTKDGKAKLYQIKQFQRILKEKQQ